MLLQYYVNTFPLHKHRKANLQIKEISIPEIKALAYFLSKNIKKSLTKNINYYITVKLFQTLYKTQKNSVLHTFQL